MALPDARAAVVNLGGGLRQSLDLATEADRGLTAKGIDLRQAGGSAEIQGDLRRHGQIVTPRLQVVHAWHEFGVG